MSVEWVLINYQGMIFLRGKDERLSEMATHLFQTCSRNSEVHSVHWKRPGEFHAGLNGVHIHVQ